MTQSTLTTESERCRICDKLVAFVNRGQLGNDELLKIERLIDDLVFDPSEHARICEKIADFLEEHGRLAPRGQLLDIERIIDHWPSCRVESLRVESAYFAGRTERALP